MISVYGTGVAHDDVEVTLHERRTPIELRSQTVALMLGVLPGTLRRWTAAGTIPSRINDAGEIVYRLSDVTWFVKPLSEEGETDA